jgi:transposase
MDLTDEQWALIQPLIPPPSPYARGRPPAAPRATLNGIFFKLRLGAPWYNLPPYAVDRYPSWQTCYRAYRRWGGSGLMEEIYKTLYRDLRHRGGLDLRRSMKIINLDGNENNLEGELNQNSDQPAIILCQLGSQSRIILSPELEDTWQGSTALLLAQVLLDEIKSRLNR